jgi:hypothetical protein
MPTTDTALEDDTNASAPADGDAAAAPMDQDPPFNLSESDPLPAPPPPAPSVAVAPAPWEGQTQVPDADGIARVHAWLVGTTSTWPADRLWALEAAMGGALRPALSDADRTAVVTAWRTLLAEHNVVEEEDDDDDDARGSGGGGGTRVT